MFSSHQHTNDNIPIGNEKHISFMNTRMCFISFKIRLSGWDMIDYMATKLLY